MSLPRLNMLWQTVGGLLAPAILTVLLIQKFTEPGLNVYQWLMWLHVPLLFLHEYEEYVLCPDGFKKFVNTSTPLALDPPQPDTPLNDIMILVINLGAWSWAIAGGLLALRAPWIGAGFIVFQLLINIITHTGVFQLGRKAYNPGLATTLGLLIPYTVVVAWYVATSGMCSLADWTLTFVLGVGVAALLPSWSLTRNMRLTKARELRRAGR